MRPGPVRRRRGRGRTDPGTLVTVLSHQPAGASPWWRSSALLRLARLPGPLGAGRPAGGPGPDRRRPSTAARTPCMSITLVERASGFLGHPALPAQLHQPVGLRRQCGGHRIRPRPGPQTGHGLRVGLQLRQQQLRVRVDLLCRLHRVLLLGQRRLQLLPDQHGDGRVVEGRQLHRSAAGPATTWTATRPASARRAAATAGASASPAATESTCGCGPNGCNSYVTGCFQFRYGQCNQQIDCIGRIVCRVVACVPPWEIDPTCTTTNAQDNSHRRAERRVLDAGVPHSRPRHPVPPPSPTARWWAWPRAPTAPATGW